jgi:2-amino-4-hydroxy-6-hydroxymethyldihydropteridine diphosphokinase
MEKAYIGLGSNLEDPIAQIEQAILSLSQIPNTVLQMKSSLYRTLPWGKTDQPEFVNAVVKIETCCSPHTLLEYLQIIEKNQKKKKIEKWGPRTIDCDLILYGNEIIESATLTVPHPRMFTRGFVMVPLAEISPMLIFPKGKSIADLLVQCDCAGIEKIC